MTFPDPSQPYDEQLATNRKREISRTIRPVGGITGLPPLTTAPKRVLLIVPPSRMEEHVGRLAAAAGDLPMLGLAYIAASLRDQGHDVRVIDYTARGLGLDRIQADLRAFRPHVVGMTAYITNMRRCVEVARIVKAVDPAITVMLGGPQVTIFPEEAFTAPEIDLVVLSEGEITIRHVMNALPDPGSLAQVAGIWFRLPDGGVQRNPRAPLVDNLDIFPEPALDLFEMAKYYPPVYIRGKKVAHILTSRGCPFQCTFCETKLTFGRSFRYHSTRRVLNELEHLIRQGYDGFQFYDDVFTVNQRRIAELCHGIIDSGWKIQWMCYTRTNTVSADLLALMRKAGCYMVSFGVESGSDALLQVVNKKLTVAENRQGIRLAKDAGLDVAATFMLGLPTELPAQTEDTIRFSLESDIDYAIFGITEPFPGTELWEDAKKYGYFDQSGKFRNNLLSEHAAVWIPNGRTREELKAAVENAMARFYLRPRSFWRAALNFWRLPFPRAVRFLWSGVAFFIIGRLRRHRPEHRSSRN